MKINGKEYLSTGETAKLLGVSRWTAIRLGKNPPPSLIIIKNSHNRRVLFEATSLEEYAKRRFKEL